MGVKVNQESSGRNGGKGDTEKRPVLRSHSNVYESRTKEVTADTPSALGQCWEEATLLWLGNRAS